MTDSKPRQKKPDWLRKRISTGKTYRHVHDMLKETGLHTVCQEALCPNLGECFSKGTSTFMILGDRCTRNCTFCAVNHQAPDSPDKNEPLKVARAVRSLGLRYAVVTSVTRDDLADGGAGHFAETIRAIRERNADTQIEVLIPDFSGSLQALDVVIEAAPDVMNHNIETVPRLYPEVRPQADYRQSLDIFVHARKQNSDLMTKSGLMLGLGEREPEVRDTFKDLLKAGCKILTLGQYLAPSSSHHPVVEYIEPKVFASWQETALAMGFQAAACGPFVRSSYNAFELFGIGSQNKSIA